MKLTCELKSGRARPEREGVTVQVQVGTMIEVPRAALIADKIAEYAEFSRSAPTI